MSSSSSSSSFTHANDVKIHIGSAKGIASSRKVYCEVVVLNSSGQVLGKPQRTKLFNKTSNPDWNEDLYFDTTNVSGFIVTVWEYHRIFPDVFLGIVTVRLRADDLKPGHLIFDNEFTLSKRKTKDKVIGTIRIAVQWKQGPEAPKSGRTKRRRNSASSSSSSSAPAPEEKGGRRQLNVSSKWASKSNELAKSGFEVVEEDVEDSAEDKSVKSPPPAKKTQASSSSSTPTTSRAVKAVAPSDPKDQIELIVKLCAEKHSIVRDVDPDNTGKNLSFALHNAEKDSESFVTLMVPDEPSDGEYMLFTNDGVIELGNVGSILAAMNKVVGKFAATHKLTSYGPKFPEPERSKEPKKHAPKKKGRAGLMESFATNTSEVFDAQEQAINEGEALSDNLQPQKRLVSFIDEFQRVHGADSCAVVKSFKATSVRLAFDGSSFLSPLLGEVWDIDITKRIVIELELNPPLFMDSTVAPKVKTFLSSSRDLTPENLSDVISFGLRWYLVKRVEKFLGANWPPKHTHLFLDIVSDATEKINSCTKTCVICDKKLEFRMLKPMICDDQLCKFSYDQYGLGTDVCAEIQHHPDVVDLLVSITYAGAQGDVRRFSPYPENVESRKKVAGQEVVKDLGTCKQPKAHEVIRLLDALPPINDLQQYKTPETLRAALDAIDVLCYPLLRWIVTSNRAHLARLKDHEKVPSAGTNLQFMFLSSPPEKERKFQQLKKKQGAFLAFHGSFFGNWHAILRCGLRNLSNTELMSAGAAYGAGIYLAADSGTSSGYAGSSGGWPKSMFNTSPGISDQYQCIAICEVIKAGYKANPYYVVPNEDHVVTRYFMIFNSANYHQTLYANNLSPPKTDYEKQLAAYGASE